MRWILIGRRSQCPRLRVFSSSGTVDFRASSDIAFNKKMKGSLVGPHQKYVFVLVSHKRERSTWRQMAEEQSSSSPSEAALKASASSPTTPQMSLFLCTFVQLILCPLSTRCQSSPSSFPLVVTSSFSLCPSAQNPRRQTHFMFHRPAIWYH